MPNNRPLVSVFLPYYNDKDFLTDSIESVLNQSYQNFELILCNHASTDTSREIAHSFIDKRIKHIDMPKNYGAGGGLVFKAMLDASSGKYIKPFCADDLLKPDCLEIMVSYLETNQTKDFVFCNVEYINEKADSLNENWFNSRPHFSIQNDEIALLKLYVKGVQTLPYIGSMVRRSDLEQISCDPSLIMLFDMSIWLQLLLQGKKVGVISDCLANYRCHNNQISGINSKHIVGRRSYFELPIFKDYFAKCQDVNLVKKIFSDDPYASLLTDKIDIPFIVYHSLYYNYDDIINCYKLHELLMDYDYRRHLVEKFNYDIDTYRKEYSYPMRVVENKKPSWFVQKIYAKPSKKLNLFELVYLQGRQIFNIMTLKLLFKFIKKKKQKKKEFSL